MSDTKSAEKLDVLFEKVYLPVFMDKLAERGIQVKSEDELQEVLKIAALTRAHVEATDAEEANAPSAIKQAAASLEALTYGEQNLASAFLQDPEVASVFAG